MNHKKLHHAILSWSVTIFLLLSLVSVGRNPTAVAQNGYFARFYGDLAPGETVTPTYPLFGSQAKNINLKLQVPAVSGGGTVALDVTDGAGGHPFAGTILDGETLWANITIQPGNNVFTLHNAGTTTVQYDLRLYEVGAAPTTWSGTSQGPGTWRSHIRLNFPANALYQFDLGVPAGRYQFLVDADYIQKTVETTGTVTCYVAAGLHDLFIMPDTASPWTDWSLTISGPGATNDTLPYAKTGGNVGGIGNDFDTEWLPLNLAAAAEANFSLTVTGDTGDAIDVYLYGATGVTPTHTIMGIYGGETVWWTTNLPAGTSRLKLVADPANTGPLAYALTIYSKPALPASWTGASHGLANNSHLRFQVTTAGLYDFAYGVTAGRYQFLVNSDPQIQKTVETTGTVRYYLAAGTHELTVVQDPAAAHTAWSLGLSGPYGTTDSLPYIQSGYNLGGTGNVFRTEWLPVNLPANSAVNIELTLQGDLNDGLTAYLYQGASSTPAYTSPVVYGGETFWFTNDLVAGVNQIKLEAGTNAGPLRYDLAIRPIQSPPYAWSGVAKGGAGNPVASVQIATGGTYHVALDTPVGFGQVIVDGTTLAAEQSADLAGHSTEFDVPLAAGRHNFALKQSAAVTTSWTISVTATAAQEVLAHFYGSLNPGEQVDPQFPLFGTADREVNFRLVTPAVIGGGQLDLTIKDGAGGTAFVGTSLDGETLWGTATLKPGQNTFILHNIGANPLQYDLTVYEIGAAPYSWAGYSQGAGSWDSHIQLSFPTSGLYDFDYSLLAGRFQFLVDALYIQKTVETTGTVRYYVPAGVYVLKIVPDRTADASWMLNISAVGAPTDDLPYTKTGGHLWAATNRFNAEWLPVNLAAATPANFKLTLTGANTDKMNVTFYAGLSPAEVYSLTNVYGGETVWGMVDLPAGLSRIHLETDAANSGALAYELALYPQPTVAPASPATWVGASQGISANNSQVRFRVSAAGLYDFAYGVTAGRYQFLVDSHPHLQKTVETTGTVRYYLAAGDHELTVVQDPAAAHTAWSLAISATGMPADELPYEKDGGNLGGVGNGFLVEWLPVVLPAGSAANFRLTLNGSLTDGLTVYLYQGATQVYTTPVVYGGETFWWTTDLAAGVNQLLLEAQGGNAGPLQYALSIQPIPTVLHGAPHTWDGLGKGGAGQSQIEVQTPVTGTYHVLLNVPHGFANLSIGPAGAISNWSTKQSQIEFDVPLSEGGHLFRVQQSAAYITTTWAVTVSMKDALAPQITAVNPPSMTNEVTTVVTIIGANFQPGATVRIDSLSLTPVTRLSSTQLQVAIPALTPVGTYTVTVTNPDSKSATLPEALIITEAQHEYRLFLPLVLRNYGG